MIETRNGRILVDGVPTLVLAGEIHYFRVPRAGWEQRIELAVEAGCTAVASYIPWLWHELPDGSIDVTGSTRPERDVGAFIDLCARHGLQFIARPGPFIMAELKNEGLPYRLYREHPEIVATGWDGAPATTATVDYLAPAYLAECRRWFDAVLPVIAARLHPAGPVIAVQLDNEIGMLAWISNSPDLTDDLLADFAGWLRRTHGAQAAVRYPVDPADPVAWRRAIESPGEDIAGDLRVDLARFMRGRFARYVDQLADLAVGNGVTGVPFLINIHGTEGGNGVPFGIGVSQLLETWRGKPGFIAGSDHYLGNMSSATTVDIHFVNAIQVAVNGTDQPLTSLEFEAGTGDYGGGLDRWYDAATVDLKTRLCLAQGNRMINYYLLAGGVNPPLDVPVGDGNDRISFTGERHGTAAPISPEGKRGQGFAATAGIGRATATHAAWLADSDEERDDLALAFLPDAFATEYHYPGSAVMARVAGDLAAHRGPGQRKALWRSLLYAGFRFGAVDLQDENADLPGVVGVASGVHLDDAVQHRLVRHLRSGGGLLWLGPLPQRDLRDRPCTVLADALGVRPGVRLAGMPRYFPSIRGHGLLDVMAETRVGWLQEIVASAVGGQPAPPEPLLTDVDGRACGVLATAGAGRAILLTAEVPSHPRLFAAAAAALGVRPGVVLTTDVPGVVVTTTSSPSGDRLLHLLNPTGYDASVTLGGAAAGPDGPAAYAVPAHTGHFLARGLTLPWGRLESATSELTAHGPDGLTVGPSLDPGGHRILLRTGREVAAPDGVEVSTIDSGLVWVTAADGSRPLSLTVR